MFREPGKKFSETVEEARAAILAGEEEKAKRMAELKTRRKLSLSTPPPSVKPRRRRFYLNVRH